jgi:hypothetical protein
MTCRVKIVNSKLVCFTLFQTKESDFGRSMEQKSDPYFPDGNRPLFFSAFFDINCFHCSGMENSCEITA